MKRIRLDRWATHLQPPRNPRLHLHQQRCPFSQDTRTAPRRQLQERHYQIQHQWQCQRRHAASRRKASSAVAAQVEDAENLEEERAPIRDETELFSPTPEQTPLNAPSHRRARHSAKLSALHSRLSLPSQLPLQTLALCLIDKTVDSRQGYNNEPLALLGQDLLGYYTSEWLICNYPRLPMPVLFAAQYAYAGSQTLAALRQEFGVEAVVAPGVEVDPGLLQLKRVVPGNAMAEGEQMQLKDMPTARRLGTGRRNEQWNYRRGISSRIVYDDQFGDLQSGLPPPDSKPYPGAPISSSTITSEDYLPPTPTPQQPESEADATTVEAASASFVRALTGALYLHAGSAATKSFHADHVLSRHLPLHTLFNFTHPTRDLSRLCAREGLEPPVARILSETGRLSRTPVFVVGVYSGDDKLGEGAGASLNEARVRAAAAALRSWYLYSPPDSEVMRPSEAEGVTGKKGRKKWKPQMIDIGEIC